MKALFFLVCLLNIWFFFWELHNGAFTPPQEPQTGVPGLLLVSERETARRGTEISRHLDRSVIEWQTKLITDISQRLDSPRDQYLLANAERIVQPSAAVQHAPPPDKCYEAGPFNDPAELQRWASTEHLKLFKPIYKSSVTASDFQVYYPAAKDSEQTRINKLMLQAKGFTDIWTVIDGEMKGAISLGVFNDKQRAMLFKTQLAERGIKAEIRQRTKTREELFIRFMAGAIVSPKPSYVNLPAADCENALK